MPCLRAWVLARRNSKAAISASISERTVVIARCSRQDGKEWAQTAHLPEGPLREGLSAMNPDYDRYGFPGGNALVLRAILEREPRTLNQYIYELASR